MFKDSPESNTLHFMLGFYFEKQGYYNEAISRIEIISKSNPNAPLPHEILGNLYTKTDLKDQAIFEFQKALELKQKKN